MHHFHHITDVERNFFQISILTPTSAGGIHHKKATGKHDGVRCWVKLARHWKLRSNLSEIEQATKISGSLVLSVTFLKLSNHLLKEVPLKTTCENSVLIPHFYMSKLHSTKKFSTSLMLHLCQKEDKRKILSISLIMENGYHILSTKKRKMQDRSLFFDKAFGFVKLHQKTGIFKWVMNKLFKKVQCALLQCPTYTCACFTVEVWGQMCPSCPCTCREQCYRKSSSAPGTRWGGVMLQLQLHVQAWGLCRKSIQKTASHTAKAAPNVANGCLIGTNGGLKHTIQTVTHTHYLISSQVRYCWFTLTLNYCYYNEHSGVVPWHTYFWV